MKPTQDKSAFYSLIFVTIVLLLIFFKGRAIEGFVMLYKRGYMLEFWGGIVGIGSAVFGWLYLLFRVILRK